MKKLYQGDARHILADFADGSVDAVVTDPSYEVGLNKTRCEWDIWPGPMIWKDLYRVTKQGGLLAFTMAPHVAHLRVPDVFSAGWELLEVGFWVWGGGRPVRKDRLKRCFDLVYFCGKKNGTRSLFTDDARMANRANAITGRWGTVTAHSGGLGSQFQDCKNSRAYECGQADYHPANVACTQDDAPFGNTGYELLFAVKRLHPVGRAYLKHPTKKPIDLMGQIVKLVSRQDETVLDPFMGDGTTGEAALILERAFIGIEAVPEYFARAKRDLEAIEAQPVLQAPVRDEVSMMQLSLE